MKSKRKFEIQKSVCSPLALGQHSFSSGIHCIRLRVEGNGVFLGIRSRNILPVPFEFAYGRYDYSPSTYGWLGEYGRIINGRFEGAHLKVVDRDKHVFALTLNCDEHRLSILNENTKERDDFEVDIAHAPFPWCLFVQLSRSTGRVSLV